MFSLSSFSFNTIFVTIFLVVITTGLLPTSVSATNANCPLGYLNHIGETFTTKSFTDVDNCLITIDSCFANVIQFTNALYNTHVVIKNLDCGHNIAAGGSHCISFQSSINGGSVSINNVTAEFGAGATSGTYIFTRFSGLVNLATAINITGLRVSGGITAASGGITVYLIYFSSASGVTNVDRVAVSECSMRGRGFVTGAGGNIYIYLIYTKLFSNVSTFEIAGNVIDIDNALTSGGSAEVNFQILRATAAISSDGTGTFSIRDVGAFRLPCCVQ